jgi:peptidylprolyl isomerase
MNRLTVFRWLTCSALVCALAACGGDSSTDDTPSGTPPTLVTDSEYTTTGSGLKFFDLTPGTGASPTTGQSVQVHYTGWLTNSVKFDSSRDRNQPFVFVIGTGQVIAGWDEGVATMKVGGKRQLVIPAALGYGARGSGAIPANATLIFEVELLQIL